ncbi:IclR family transcriptional regulator [Arthrobacter sp.]|uniref:IclR family transcriptional regulator n=1 Tax=Arthrobacter sp. TaxID=1667 RepID=UPI003A90FA6A
MGTHPATDVGVREVKSAARAIEVLELLASRGGDPVTIRELCTAMGAPRSSVYALLKTLTDAGWVRTDAHRATYGIGIRALLAGTTYLDADPWLQVVRPHLGLLGRRLGATVNFGRLDGDHIVYLATWESPGRERPIPRVGRRLPAHATALGQAILAQLPPADPATADGSIRELEALTPRTLTSPNALHEELALVAQRGYAREIGQNTEGVACLAVHLDCYGTGHDALSVSVPEEELTAARERTVVDALRTTASVVQEILTGLAGRPA